LAEELAADVAPLIEEFLAATSPHPPTSAAPRRAQRTGP
jgi:hypothetical protein